MFQEKKKSAQDQRDSFWLKMCIESLSQGITEHYFFFFLFFYSMPFSSFGFRSTLFFSCFIIISKLRSIKQLFFAFKSALWRQAFSHFRHKESGRDVIRPFILSPSYIHLQFSISMRNIQTNMNTLPLPQLRLLSQNNFFNRLQN